MNYDKYNEFVLNYIENDKTNRALMISSGWGTGKSHYVKEHLKKYLKENEYKCVIVSLYGITELTEISKAIYLDLRRIGKNSKSEAKNTARVAGKIIGKTIFNGLVSKAGVDIGSITDKDLMKVYESVNLSRTLIVLEDVERTKINILDLFGYVNNLCEYDKAKVLLVSNEDEFIETEKMDNGKLDYKEKTKHYLKIKEKTIGDTLDFQCDYYSEISEIMDGFNMCIKKYNDPIVISEIISLMSKKNINLRTFIYACQKTQDIINYLWKNNVDLGDNIEKIIFLGIIGFTNRISLGRQVKFEDGTFISATAGANHDYPLFRFCYEYIVYQILIPVREIKQATEYYLDYRKNAQWYRGKDEDLLTIKKYYIKSEKDIRNAILRIPDKIKNGDIPYYDYGVLITYLIKLKYDIGFNIDVDEIEKTMMKSIHGRENKAEHIELFIEGIAIDNNTGIAKLSKIKNEFEEAMNGKNTHEFEYNPQNVIEYCKNNIQYAQSNIGKIGGYRIEPDRFLELIKKCNPEQLDEIRNFIKGIYDQPDKRDVSDIMGDFKEIRDRLSEEENDEFDMIQRLQVHWMIKDLDDVINRYKYQRTLVRASYGGLADDIEEHLADILK